MGQVGTLALIGGSEWRDGCSFDKGLLELANSDEVLIIPTAAAYEYPDRAVRWASGYFESLGARTRSLALLTRPDAFQAAVVDEIEAASFLYIGGGSPLHLRSVLKNTPAYRAIVRTFARGAVLAASSAGAMVLTDPMADPRGGALTVGLGLIENMAVVPHFDTYPRERENRTISLAIDGVLVAGIAEQTALIRSPEGEWRSEGLGKVVVYSDGIPISLDGLDAKIRVQLGTP